MTGASDDARVQVIRVMRETPRTVDIDTFTLKDGATERTIRNNDKLLATYVVISSTDGTQPYELAFNVSAGSRPPDLNIPFFCGAAHRTPAGELAAAANLALALALGLWFRLWLRQKRARA